MKRILFTLVLLALSAALFAQSEIYPILTPKNAKMMGMGGVFTAVPTGEMAFFGNPASFAAKRGSLTLISNDTWLYFKPTQANMDSVFAAAGGTSSPLSALASLMPTNGGFGAGTSMGLGFAGRGLGLGLFATTDLFAAGDSPAQAVLRSDTQVNAVIGLGVPLDILGMRLSIGGDLRPFYRMRTGAALADIVTTIATGGDVEAQVLGITVTSGFGLAADLGATLQLGTLTFGLSIRDIAPSFPIADTTLEGLVTALEGGSLPATTADSPKAVFIPSISAGLSWAPRIIPYVLEPSLYLEMQDPITVIRDKESPLKLLHAGAELKLLSFVYLRGGINRGWVSVGGGIKLLFLDINASVFTEELGLLPGDNPRSGVAIQAAIRF
jgi:hypothetical protein